MILQKNLQEYKNFLRKKFIKKTLLKKLNFKQMAQKLIIDFWRIFQSRDALKTYMKSP